MCVEAGVPLRCLDGSVHVDRGQVHGERLDDSRLGHEASAVEEVGLVVLALDTKVVVQRRRAPQADLDRLLPASTERLGEQTGGVATIP
jgi:hypothetical protein